MNDALTLRPSGKTYDNQPRYEVMAGQQVVGSIEGHHPTFERRSPGKRYVNARWTSKRRYWRAVDLKGHTISWANETRQRAMRYFEHEPNAARETPNDERK